MKKHIFCPRKVALMVFAVTMVWQSGLSMESEGEARSLSATQFGYRTEIIHLAVMLLVTSNFSNPAAMQNIIRTKDLTAVQKKEEQDAKKAGKDPSHEIQRIRKWQADKRKELFLVEYKKALGPGMLSAMNQARVDFSQQPPHVSLAYANMPITRSLRNKIGASISDSPEVVAKLLEKTIRNRVGGFFKNPFSLIFNSFQEGTMKNPFTIYGGLSAPHKSLVVRYSTSQKGVGKTSLEELFYKTKEFIQDTCDGQVWFNFDSLTPHVTLIQFDNALLETFLSPVAAMMKTSLSPITFYAGNQGATWHSDWLWVSAHAGIDRNNLPLPCRDVFVRGGGVPRAESEVSSYPAAQAAVTQRLAQIRMGKEEEIVPLQGGGVPRTMETRRAAQFAQPAIGNEKNILDVIKNYANRIKVDHYGVLDLSNLELISLKGLESLSPEIKNKVEILVLSKNKLTSIPTNAFQGLNNLQKLYLYGNQITSISANAFQGLNNLQELDLGGNQLTNISANAFQGLDKLKKINFLGNNLTRYNKEQIYSSLSRKETAITW